jgi:hypothetical protein
LISPSYEEIAGVVGASRPVSKRLRQMKRDRLLFLRGRRFIVNVKGSRVFSLQRLIARVTWSHQSKNSHPAR